MLSNNVQASAGLKTRASLRAYVRRELEWLLEEDQKQGLLRRNQNGRINIQYYADRLKVGRWMLDAERPLIDRFEETPEQEIQRKVAELEAWLQERLREGSLQIFGNCVARKPIFERFRIWQGARGRSELLKTLQSFEASLSPDDLARCAYGARYQALVDLLASGDVPLRRDGVNADRAAISKIVGIPTQMMRGDHPLAKIVTRFDEARRAAADKFAQSIDPVIGGTRLWFSRLLSNWPAAMVEAIARRATFELGDKCGRYALECCRAITSLLTHWHLSSKAAARQVAECLRAGTVCPPEVLVEAARDWSGNLATNRNAAGLAVRKTNCLIYRGTLALGIMARAGVLPALAFRLPTIDSRGRSSKPLPTVAELKSRDVATRQADEVRRLAGHVLQAAALESGQSCDYQDAAAFLDGLGLVRAP